MAKMKVLMVSAEVEPFAKTGGLGDVVGSLPKALNKSNVNTRVIMPLYGQISPKYKEKMKYLGYIYVDVGWRHQYCGIYSLRHQYTTYYFVDNEFYFKRDKFYDDLDLEKFAFLSLAAFEVAKYVRFRPDVIHSHDWHTGVISALLNRPRLSAVSYCKLVKSMFETVFEPDINAPRTPIKGAITT